MTREHTEKGNKRSDNRMEKDMRKKEGRVSIFILKFSLKAKFGPSTIKITVSVLKLS